VHQFTVQQVGKGGNNVIIIDQGITHHTEFNPQYTCSYKGNLLPEYEIRLRFTAWQVGKVIFTNQVITDHTNFNHEYA